MLNKKQKKEIYDLIETAGFSASDFNGTQIKSSKDSDETAFLLEHNKSEYYFQFDLFNGQHWAEFSPGKDRLISNEYPGEWESQISYFKLWLNYLKDDIDVEDVWSDYYKAGKYINFDDFQDNVPFSADEIKIIQIKIALIQNEVNKLYISEDQKNLINEKLDYIFEKSKEIGKMDWKALAIGYILQLAIPTETIQQVLKIIGGIFNQIFLK